MLVVSQKDFDAARDADELPASTSSGGMLSLNTVIGKYAIRYSGKDYYLNDWYTGNITDMSGYFENADVFDSQDDRYDITGWNVAGVTHMSKMFYDATGFNQDIGRLGC